VLGRRLDRYVGFSFLWHFVLSLVAVVGLYVVIDTFRNLDDFLEKEGIVGKIRCILIYHAYQIPVLLTQFLPLVTLLAGIISLSRLARYNELNAMKAAGVSMRRALAPILLASLAIGALSAANQELLVPTMEAGILDARTLLRPKDVHKGLYVYDRKANTTLWVKELQNAAAGIEIRGLQVIPKAPSHPGKNTGGPRIRGASAVWVGHWLFISEGETLNAEGQWQRFQCRDSADGSRPRKYEVLATDVEAAAVKETIGSPLPRIEASLGGAPVEVTFANAKYTLAYGFRLICEGQLNRTIEEEGTDVPIHIRPALWLHGEWIGCASSYRVSQQRRHEITYDGEPLPFKMTPHEITRNNQDPMLKSFRELLAQAKTPIPERRQIILVTLHGRVAFPFASFILLLVAFPLLFQREGGRSTWVGVGLALLVSVSFYFVNSTFQLAGQAADGVFADAPALAAWLPLIMFGIAGVILTARMET
jgi:lipopolysaccharide export LptBFGC system permease protein LptF